VDESITSNNSMNEEEASDLKHSVHVGPIIEDLTFSIQKSLFLLFLGESAGSNLG